MPGCSKSPQTNLEPALGETQSTSKTIVCRARAIAKGWRLGGENVKKQNKKRHVQLFPNGGMAGPPEEAT